MVKCIDCPYYDREVEACTKEPSNMSSPICLKRHECWLLAQILEELRMEDEGEDWKYA